MRLKKNKNTSPLKELLTGLYCLLSIVALSGCKKFIHVDAPVNNINAANVYSSDATAAAVITGIYQKMSKDNSDQYNAVGQLSNIHSTAGLVSDELTLFNETDPARQPYYFNNLTAINSPGIWGKAYSVIFIANSAIEGIQNNSKLSSLLRQQLLGEAKFLRAFNYFYLINFYGDVPLVLTTDYKINAQQGKSPKSEVYNQIIADLKDAQELLSKDYLKGDAMSAYTNGSEERVRPTKWAAAALLARTNLYTGSWVEAEAEATKVINHSYLYELEALSNVFLKNNREAIWQLQPVNNGVNANTGEGKLFVLPATGPTSSFPVFMRKELFSAFEDGDQRQVQWTGNVTVEGLNYYYPYKYKIGRTENVPSAEYPTILRLAELYLIRAEARAHQNNVEGAANDLDIVRHRAGLPQVTAATKEEMLTAILQERRVELFTEWGHRWFDLIRTGNADAVLGHLKGSDWQPTDKLFPIPLSEIQRSPNISQNPAY